ncbi:MAG: peptidoglycan/LPS O-acetylase OafA/YrhL [Myxococcota bacterium]|jgi:peptidoglycan/LPS O-acetylase OafA/YrhL
MTQRRDYMPQLDGLRAVAVLAVMVRHFVPETTAWFDLGRFGVLLFFVLSGYLITGILLGCRDRCDAEGANRSSVAKRFYIRRFIRIFPIYYITLAVIWGVSHWPVFVRAVPAVEEWIAPLPWLITYTFNLYWGITNVNAGQLSHLWSLAVEEQFYLIWPWVLLFARRRAFLPLLVAGIALGPAYRLFAIISGWSYAAVAFVTIACLDTLAMGSLLAWAERGSETAKGWMERLVPWCGVGGVLLLILPAFVDVVGTGALFDTGVGLVSVWLVFGGARGFRGPFGRLLEWGPARYLGRISYGLYLYHNLMPTFVRLCLSAIGVPIEALGPATPFALAAATVAVAAASWALIEAPLNRLKRGYPYFDPSPSAPAG